MRQRTRQEAERAQEQADARAARELQAQFDRQLVQGQNSSYEKSLRVDQERKRERAEGESRKEEAQKEERRLQQRQKERESERHRLRQELRAEPEADAEGVVVLAFRLPSGSRLSRRFLESDPLHTVLAFCKQSEQVIDAIPGELQLSSSFPRRIFDEEDATSSLTDLGLAPKALLVLRSADA